MPGMRSTAFTGPDKDTLRPPMSRRAFLRTIAAAVGALGIVTQVDKLSNLVPVSKDHDFSKIRSITFPIKFLTKESEPYHNEITGNELVQLKEAFKKLNIPCNDSTVDITLNIEDLRNKGVGLGFTTLVPPSLENKAAGGLPAQTEALYLEFQGVRWTINESLVKRTFKPEIDSKK